MEQGWAHYRAPRVLVALGRLPPPYWHGQGLLEQQLIGPGVRRPPV